MSTMYAAMVEGEQRGTVWPEDVPEDVLGGSGEPASPPIVPELAEPRTKSRGGHLKLVD